MLCSVKPMPFHDMKAESPGQPHASEVHLAKSTRACQSPKMSGDKTLNFFDSLSCVSCQRVPSSPSNRCFIPMDIFSIGIPEKNSDSQFSKWRSSGKKSKERRIKALGCRFPILRRPTFILSWVISWYGRVLVLNQLCKTHFLDCMACPHGDNVLNVALDDYKMCDWESVEIVNRHKTSWIKRGDGAPIATWKVLHITSHQKPMNNTENEALDEASVHNCYFQTINKESTVALTCIDFRERYQTIPPCLHYTNSGRPCRSQAAFCDCFVWVLCTFHFFKALLKWRQLAIPHRPAR